MSTIANPISHALPTRPGHRMAAAAEQPVEAIKIAGESFTPSSQSPVPPSRPLAAAPEPLVEVPAHSPAAEHAQPANTGLAPTAERAPTVLLDLGETNPFFPAGLVGGDAPTSGLATAALLADPLARAVEAARTGSSQIDVAARELKKLTLEHVRASEQSMAAMGMAPTQVGLFDEPLSPLQDAWHQSILKASLAACSAGALEGVQAYVAGLAPRATPLSAKDSAGVYQVAESLHQRGMHVTDTADSTREAGNGQEMHKKGVSNQNRNLDMATDAVPRRTARGELIYGHVNELLRGSYDAGVRLGVAAAARQGA